MHDSWTLPRRVLSSFALAAAMLGLTGADALAVTQPVITSATVTGSAPAQQLVLNGTGFTGIATVLIGPMANLSPAAQTDTQLTFNLAVPLLPGTYAVSLKVASGSGQKDPYFVDEAFVAVGAVGATGPQGPAGPAGPAGPQGATGRAGANGVSGYERIASSHTISNGAMAFNYSSCPGTKVAISGGFQVDSLLTPQQYTSFYVHQSYADTNGSWFMLVSNGSGVNASATFWVVCVNAI